MGNFFSDLGGGLLGQGPGTESMSGEEYLPTEKRQGLQVLRNFMLDSRPNEGGYGSFFHPSYEAIPQADRERYTGRVREAYDITRNPFLKDLQSSVDAQLSRSGLLTTSRSAFLRGTMQQERDIGARLAEMATATDFEEKSRQETLRNRLSILDRALGVDYPGQVEIDKPQSMERAFGSLAGRAGAAYLTGGFSELPGMFSSGAPKSTPFSGQPTSSLGGMR